MRSVRHNETRMLGYDIERLEEYDEGGLLQSVRYEVLCPLTSAVLASQTTLRAARRSVIAHELGGLGRRSRTRVA